MIDNKLQVTVDVDRQEDDSYVFNILASESLDTETIRSILAGGLALTIRAAKTPKEQGRILKEVIDYLESEFINPDSFSDAQSYI